MTMVSSGPISLGGTATSGGLNQSINVELGYSGTAQISLNDSAVRTLLAVPSGAISLNNAYGKANAFTLTISANQTNANLRTLAVNAGWNQTVKVNATINSGIYVSSNSTATPALTVSGSFPGGVTLTNNGFIVGMGGAGGPGNTGAGSAGGLALSVSTAITIDNTNGTVAGGGGGGGAGNNGQWTDGGEVPQTYTTGGGGGGGGRSSNAANSAGGAGGGGTNGNGASGNPGTVSAAGTGGAGATGTQNGGTGGTGGGWGTSGSTGGASNQGAGGAGGSGGGAVSGNANITWTATGTRLGAIT